MRPTSWIFMLIGWLLAFSAGPAGGGTSPDCNRYSDNFDRLDPTRWQEVLLYSPGDGAVRIQEQALALTANSQTPTEIQVYALFSFAGDFDIQADYRLPAPVPGHHCRLNAGMVLQTPGDALSFKCYVGFREGGESMFRGRLDAEGEHNLESYKIKGAAQQGALRMVRQHGTIRLLARTDRDWIEICRFRQACTDPVRLRFKLQTGDDEPGGSACPTTVLFDQFRIHHCETITPD